MHHTLSPFGLDRKEINDKNNCNRSSFSRKSVLCCKWISFNCWNRKSQPEVLWSPHASVDCIFMKTATLPPLAAHGWPHSQRYMTQISLVHMQMHVIWTRNRFKLVVEMRVPNICVWSRGNCAQRVSRARSTQLRCVRWKGCVCVRVSAWRARNVRIIWRCSFVVSILMHLDASKKHICRIPMQLLVPCERLVSLFVFRHVIVWTKKMNSSNDAHYVSEKSNYPVDLCSNGLHDVCMCRQREQMEQGKNEKKKKTGTLHMTFGS